MTITRQDAYQCIADLLADGCTWDEVAAAMDQSFNELVTLVNTGGVFSVTFVDHDGETVTEAITLADNGDETATLIIGGQTCVIPKGPHPVVPDVYTLTITQGPTTLGTFDADLADATIDIPAPASDVGQAVVVGNNNGTATVTATDTAGNVTTCDVSTEKVDFACVKQAIRRRTTDLKTNSASDHFSNPTYSTRASVSIGSSIDSIGAIQPSTAVGPLISSPTTTVNIPQCGGRIKGIAAHGLFAAGGTPPSDGLLTVQEDITYDAGATYTQMNGGGGDQYRANGVGGSAGEYGFTRFHTSDFLPCGPVQVGLRLRLSQNSIVGGGVHTSVATLNVDTIQEVCC